MFGCDSQEHVKNDWTSDDWLSIQSVSRSLVMDNLDCW